MYSVDELREFVPYYLTKDKSSGFFSELKKFFDGQSIGYYTGPFSDSWVQGDCCQSAPMIDIVSGQRKNVVSLVVSNSCDIDPTNPRPIPAMTMIAPIITVSSFRKMLEDANKTPASVEATINSSKEQKITNLFYLPSVSVIEDDGLVMLDRIFHVPYSMLPSAPEYRDFSLSQVGFYLLLVKLSMHFSRFHEEIER